MRTRLIVATILSGGIALVIGGALAFGGPPPASTTNYPDLRTVVPKHLNLVNAQQREHLRFTNGLANTGGGAWALRPDPPLGTAPITNAIQEIRSNGAQFLCGTQKKPSDPCYTVLGEQVVSTFEYHPTHNHWHTADVARFEVRQGSPTGTIVGGNSVKVGFCLIDVYNLSGNAPTSEKVFWDCYTSYQGISVGWVDQYHHALDGQELDLTGVPNGSNYYLVSKVNPDGAFLEQSTSNNTAWVKFTLSSLGNGNRKVTVTANSPCESPGLCGAFSANR